MSDERELLVLIKKIHSDCFYLCKKVVGEYLPVAGNIGIFCQSEEEYQKLTELREQLTLLSDNSNQKYFRLKTPIIIPQTEGVPETVYEYLYIRKPAADSPQLGDVDFVLEQDKFNELKQKVSMGKIQNASIYDRPGWDTIEIRDSEIPALAYISTKEMGEKVRIKFD